MEPLCAVPDNVLSLLKCSLCESYLSVLPITLISEDGNQYKCGRCSTVKTIINTRALIYEHLAKLMTFSCNYSGCGKKIPFTDVRDHEKVCDQKSVACPKEKCNEVVKVSKFGAHFKEKHADAHHVNSFLIKNIYINSNIDVLEKNGKTYLAIFDFDDVNFGLSVCALDPSDNGQYEVKLRNEKSNYTINIAGQNVIAFNDREHCIKCIGGTCKSKSHMYRENRRDILKRMTTRINRDCIKRMIGTGNLSYTINVYEEGEKPKDDSKIEVKDAIIRKAKKIFLQLLECPCCKEYMSPPIYQCLAGHTVCNVCKPTYEKCPSCEELIQKTRNFTLEELSKKVELPADDKKVKPDTSLKRAAEENGNADNQAKIAKN
ncbi:uncharacterized protein [Diabrotica undecimpunctata]|uniref:uncharacterized protein n=1 Tax=Diabrotica undecimpunctata TaxID=50387 RepID=UPI003B63828B